MKIAAFDSGIGGLTAIAPLLKTHPGVSVVYYGDLANLPYGTKSPQRVQELTRRNLEALLSEPGFELGVIACNTASAHAMEIGREIGRAKKVPVVGVLEPGCLAAIGSAKNRIVVLCTSSTLRSQAYITELERLGCALPILQKACPLFVPLVEEGLSASPAADWAIRHYLEPLLREGDTVILGCTHYPFLVPLLRKIFPECSWIDAGASLIADPEVQKLLGRVDPSATPASTRLEMRFSDKTVTEESVRRMLQDLGLGGVSASFSFVAPH
jgi:glutamate racemase